MDWNEFCEKLNMILRGTKNRLKFICNENEIVFSIGEQTYKYSVEDYEEWKRKALCHVYQTLLFILAVNMK